eukprot:1152051-Pelagomonas_calceolata.AAC.3
MNLRRAIGPRDIPLSPVRQWGPKRGFSWWQRSRAFLGSSCRSRRKTLAALLLLLLLDRAAVVAGDSLLFANMRCTWSAKEIVHSPIVICGSFSCKARSCKPHFTPRRKYDVHSRVATHAGNRCKSTDARVQMREHRCKSTDARAQMREHRCKSTDARAQMQEYRCKSTDARVQMQEYTCKSTDARVHMQEHRCKSTGAREHMQEHRCKSTDRSVSSLEVRGSFDIAKASLVCVHDAASFGCCHHHAHCRLQV